MKVSFFAILIALCLIGQTAQSQTTKSKRPYRVWVSPLDSDTKLDGYLIQTKDSSIVISQVPASKTTPVALQEISVSSIKDLKFRKKSKVGISIAQGILAELALSAVLTAATGDPFVAAAGLLYMPIAAAIGGVVGSIKTKVPINGNQLQYQQSRAKLLKYTAPNGQHITNALEATTSNL